MRNVYAFGHKNPDTDSVTASIAISYLKNSLNVPCEPMILGKINNETKFVLDYFNEKVPNFLEDVKLQIKDLNYYKNCYVKDTDSLLKVYNYMCSKDITGVPVVNSEKKFIGLLTSKMIGSELITGNFTHLNTSYDNILKVLNGEEILKFDSEITGDIIAASYRSTTFLENFDLKPDTIMIVGNRHSIIDAAINSKIKLIIIVSSLEIESEHLQMAKENKVNIIRTNYDTYHTAKLIDLANYSKNLLNKMRDISFNENDYYNDFKEKGNKLGFNNYPVVNNKNICLGLIRATDLSDKHRKQVILVDHNESSQSVDGLDEAEILEIIDHHKLGNITTRMPINFRNMTVGSSNTIIFSMYNENNIEIPPNIAGIMLSGIISDTLKFTSPTTTEYDKYAAYRLANIASIDIDEYASKMFKAGTNLKGKTIEEIICKDLKVYEEGNKKIAISQIITLNSEEILEKKDEYNKKINELKNNGNYDTFIVCITDIIKNGSYLFYDKESEDLLNKAFDVKIYGGFFFKGCLSRKKQIVPSVMRAI